MITITPETLYIGLGFFGIVMFSVGLVVGFNIADD